MCQVLRQTQELNVLACLGSRERLFERFFLLLGGGVLLERRYRGTALVAIGKSCLVRPLYGGTAARRSPAKRCESA